LEAGPGPTLAQPDFTRQIIQLGLPVVIVMGQPATLPVPDMQAISAARSQELGRIVRSVLIELLLYGTLMTLYVLVILRLLPAPLQSLFHNNLLVYAAVSLLLIVAQGALLEALTSFLLDRLRLERFE
jgi:hypothetical protein